MGFKPAKCPDDCVFRITVNGGIPMCGYLHITGELWGCDPGVGCEKYSVIHTQEHNRERHKGREPIWDVEIGRKMWAEGYSDSQIGKKLGVRRETVARYRERHWGAINLHRQNIDRNGGKDNGGE